MMFPCLQKQEFLKLYFIFISICFPDTLFHHTQVFKKRFVCYHHFLPFQPLFFLFATYRACLWEDLILSGRRSNDKEYIKGIGSGWVEAICVAFSFACIINHHGLNSLKTTHL